MKKLFNKKLFTAVGILGFLGFITYCGRPSAPDSAAGILAAAKIIRQCDYAHPNNCYEILRAGKGGGSYGSYDPYNPYSPYSDDSSYSDYSPYNPYNPYDPYSYSVGQLRIRYSPNDVEVRDGYVGDFNNKIFFDANLQRLFAPENSLP